MKYSFVLILALVFSIGIHAQSAYNQSIIEYRQGHTKGLLSDPRAPLKSGDERYLQFFAPDQKYCVTADFTLTPGTQPFLINTHSGKQKPFREYGYLTFTINDTLHKLHVYQMLNMLNNAAYKDELFVPFTDETNYITTFAGGRYIDLMVGDIKNNKCVIDFNKCYNPLCAYADGFSCPIPPSENHLNIAIPAGEKMYTKNMQ